MDMTNDRREIGGLSIVPGTRKVTTFAATSSEARNYLFALKATATGSFG